MWTIGLIDEQCDTADGQQLPLFNTLKTSHDNTIYFNTLTPTVVIWVQL